MDATTSAFTMNRKRQVVEADVSPLMIDCYWFRVFGDKQPSLLLCIAFRSHFFHIWPTIPPTDGFDIGIGHWDNYVLHIFSGKETGCLGSNNITSSVAHMSRTLSRRRSSPDRGRRSDKSTNGYKAYTQMIHLDLRRDQSWTSYLISVRWLVAPSRPAPQWPLPHWR